MAARPEPKVAKPDLPGVQVQEPQYQIQYRAVQAGGEKVRTQAESDRNMKVFCDELRKGKYTQDLVKQVCSKTDKAYEQTGKAPELDWSHIRYEDPDHLR